MPGARARGNFDSWILVSVEGPCQPGDAPALDKYDIESALRPAIAKAAQQEKLRRPAYFALLSCINAGCRITRSAAAAHFDKYPGLAVQRDGVDFAGAIAHIARHYAQAAFAQVVAGAFFGRGAAALSGTVPRRLRRGQAAFVRLQAMLLARPASSRRRGAQRRIRCQRDADGAGS